MKNPFKPLSFHKALILLFWTHLLPFLLDSGSILAQTRRVVTAEGEVNLKIRKDEFLLLMKPDSIVTPGLLLGMSIKNTQFASAKFLTKGRSADADQVLENFEKIKFSSTFAYVGALIEDQAGNIQGIVNKISVRLKAAGDKPLLDKQLLKYGVDSVISYPYDSLTYTVYISKNNSIDALDISNELNETNLFEYSDVLWIRFISTRRANEYDGPDAEEVSHNLAWKIATGQGIKVALLDDGVQLDHPDLKDNLLPGYDAVLENSTLQGGQAGNNVHGTACAGIIGAQKNNLGFTGIAYDCKIIPVRIGFTNELGKFASNDLAVADAIYWAVNTGNADILSCSWGGGTTSGRVRVALNHAMNRGRSGKGTIVVFASGNSNESYLSYPANIAGVIAVGASTLCDTRKRSAADAARVSCDGESDWGSNYGEGLSVVAQGVKVGTTDLAGSRGKNKGDYQENFNGTSSACPQIAGIMALILSANPTLTLKQARALLEANADKLPNYRFELKGTYPNGTWNKELGYGRANAIQSLSKTQDVPSKQSLLTPNAN